MPQNLREIRRKIKTVQSIWKITRAMKMVAAAKLRRLQASVESGRAYWQRLDEIMAHVGAQAGEVSHPFIEPSEVPDIALLVVGGARGLCGSYNVALLREAAQFTASTRRPLHITTIGPRARLFFAHQDVDVFQELEVPDEQHRLLQAREISRMLRQAYLDGSVGEVHAVYTHFHSAIRTVPTVRQILPIKPPARSHDEPLLQSQRATIFEPPAEQLLASLLPRAIDAMIYEMLLQSAASEEGARMAAMTAATDNAQEMTTNLTRELNRARQWQITSEILEIIAGADALTNA